jgi:hypothetical protein
LLDGKSLLLDEDTAAAEQVVFAAPMTASDIVNQILLGAPKNKAASLDASSRLVLSSKTMGGASTLAVSGSAAPILGLPQGSATGQNVFDDGASKIGFAGQGATVRGALVSLLDTTSNLLATKAARSGDTFTGPVSFNETVTFLGAVQEMKFAKLPDADSTIQAATANLLYLPPYIVVRTYTLAEPGAGPRKVRIVRPIASTGGAVIKRAADGVVMISLQGNSGGWVEFWHVDGAWRPVAWAGNGVTPAAW